jgi:hypothetical protein
MWRNKTKDNNPASSAIFVLYINEIRSITNFCMKIKKVYRDKKV